MSFIGFQQVVGLTENERFGSLPKVQFLVTKKGKVIEFGLALRVIPPGNGKHSLRMEHPSCKKPAVRAARRLRARHSAKPQGDLKP
jgi:hypothetical protein